MSGFVYLWFDRKHQRFYVGCHWGAEDDGYVCSSRWMRKAYRRRPEDFKRRVIAQVTTTRTDLLEEEHRWLSMIKDHELKRRYYNATKHHNGHWSSDEGQRELVAGKLRGQTRSEESRQRMSAAHKGKPSLKKGVPLSEEHKIKISIANKGKLCPMAGKNHTPETRRKMSEAKKGRPSPRKGIVMSDEQKAKISASKLGKKVSRRSR